eukprot:6132879-Pyramimonas_sp.AAC.1
MTTRSQGEHKVRALEGRRPQLPQGAPSLHHRPSRPVVCVITGEEYARGKSYISLARTVDDLGPSFMPACLYACYVAEVPALAPVMARCSEHHHLARQLVSTTRQS